LTESLETDDETDKTCFKKGQERLGEKMHGL